eukprot:8985746-Ditylum_brightwellii.AAC.1
MEKSADLTTVELPRVHTVPSLSTPVLKRGRSAITNMQEKRARFCSDNNGDSTFFADYAQKLTKPQAFHVGSMTTEEKHEGIAQEWHRAVKKTVNVCAYCSSIDLSNRAYYLCTDQFDTFYGA